VQTICECIGYLRMMQSFIVMKMRSGLCALQECSVKWLLKLNASKCKSVYYGRNIDHNYAYYLHYTKLENVNVIKDSGVNFDPDLSFVLHCQEKINKAYAMLGIMRS